MSLGNLKSYEILFYSENMHERIFTNSMGLYFMYLQTAISIGPTSWTEMKQTCIEKKLDLIVYRTQIVLNFLENDESLLQGLLKSIKRNLKVAI